VCISLVSVVNHNTISRQPFWEHKSVRNSAIGGNENIEDRGVAGDISMRISKTAAWQAILV